MLAVAKHSSFLRKSVNYGRKKFYSTGPSGANVIKLFTVAIYCRSMVVPSFCVINQYYHSNYHRIVVHYYCTYFNSID
jgi:hypothetical protein